MGLRVVIAEEPFHRSRFIDLTGDPGRRMFLGAKCAAKQHDDRSAFHPVLASNNRVPGAADLCQKGVIYFELCSRGATCRLSESTIRTRSNNRAARNLLGKLLCPS